MQNKSELRQDIVSGDWVAIATGRGRRPNDFVAHPRDHFWKKTKNCPFEKILGPSFYIILNNGEIHRPSKKNKTLLQKNWFLQMLPNKFPAFSHGICGVIKKEGPYKWEDGVGFHDVVVTRSHEKTIAFMSQKEVESIIHAYRYRYLSLKDDDCVQYISIFHNHGPEAGATLAHPHSQIIAIPVVPADVSRSIRGSANFFHKNKKCVHCLVAVFERKEKKRVIYENERFIAFTPFASRAAFEIRIFPKAHMPMFESINHEDISYFADSLKTVLRKLYEGLGNPSYNFFIHTAPAYDTKEFEHYHWHLEILPKTAVWAGFELSTGIDISTIAPEKAAAFLRKLK